MTINIEFGPLSALYWIEEGHFRTIGEKVWKWDGKRWRLRRTLPLSLRNLVTNRAVDND